MRDLSEAGDALEILREGLDDDPERERALGRVVLGLLFVQLAEARAMLPRGELADWACVLGRLDDLHRERGGWLFAPRQLAPLRELCVATPAVRAVRDRLAVYADAELEILGAVYEATRSSAARRRTSTHYTPRPLADAIVERGLAPHLRARRPESLAVCDPAMGSGAFVLAACRALGERIDHPEGRLIAALCCVHGVDEDPTAVALARLSLWLEAGARRARFDCFDRSLRRGDALVGLDLESLRALDSPHLTLALERHTQLRASAANLARDPSPEAIRRDTSAWRDHERELAPLRALADRVIAAFFASTRARERARALAALHRDGAELELPRSLRPLHWPLEFSRCAPDPDLGGEARGFDALVGNPPFAGKNNLIAQRGRAYLDWLKQVHPGSHGNADYAAHFFRRADVLLGRSGGTIGFVATNTIGQGDTRTTGLAALVEAGAEIYDAREHLEWPGVANVTVSVVHLVRGDAILAAGLERRLDGERVEQIDSRLRPRVERPDPAPLAEARGRAFIGTYVLGRGFVLTPAQRDALVARDPRNAAHIKAYIGGRELNHSPTQAASRCVIDFGELPLSEAERYPDLLEILRREVKPQRDALADNPDGRRRRARWWQHGRVTPSLQAALAPLARCLVTSLVSKHLVFAFSPADRLFSHKLCVFPLDADADFAVLQSRVHAIWARLHSSTMRNAGLNYSPSDCFDSFAWPRPDAAGLDALARAGRELDAARRALMLEAEVGLTATYNALTDPRRDEAAIVRLRARHVAIDRAVLDAYAWTDLDAPAYLDADPRFEAALIDRLYALNAARSQPRA